MYCMTGDVGDTTGRSDILNSRYSRCCVLLELGTNPQPAPYVRTTHRTGTVDHASRGDAAFRNKVLNVGTRSPVALHVQVTTDSLGETEVTLQAYNGYRLYMCR